MSKGKGPHLPNLSGYSEAGIDPRTGEPLRGFDPADKKNIKRQLRILDEQDFVNRYQWYNLPSGISSQELERMLYYRGQLMFFYFKETDEFFFMPYTLTNGEDGKQPLDFYGRFRYIHPVPFAEGTTEEEKKDASRLRTLLSMTAYKVAYGVHYMELSEDDLYYSAVIVRDYTPQIGQIITPRKDLNDAILDLESICFPYMRTALKNGTGVEGVKTTNEDESSNVYAFNKTADVAALTGDRLIPIQASIEMQELAGGQVAKAEEFLLAMESMDNYRLSLLGIDNGGIFQKKAHMLQDEQNMNAGVANIPLQDGLAQRQRFCDIANSIWGLGIWCEISEAVIGIDRDMDGEAAEDDPQDESYESNEMGGDNGD